MKQTIIIFFSLLLLSSCSLNKEKQCHLSGKVVNRDSKTLILIKQTDDLRYGGIEIPIDSCGNFAYEMNFQFVEAYELVFKEEWLNGCWKPILFFPDNNRIEFTLYPMEMDKADSNKIEGSKLSLIEEIYNQKVMDKYYNKYDFWHQILDSLKNINEINSDYYETISDSIQSIMHEIPFFEFTNCVKQQINIYGYSKLLNTLRAEKERRIFKNDTLKKYCELFQNEFPNHPYNEIAQFRLDALTNIKIGGNYVNFVAKDSIGTKIVLSDLISKNRFTLIDLWSPWCGPCIRGSKKNIPVYKDLKEYGFEIVGIIGGVKNQEQFLEAKRSHNYPWLQLAEICDENNIWEKYNISQSGGCKFLVNNKGKIIAIDPEPEEIRKLVMK